MSEILAAIAHHAATRPNEPAVVGAQVTLSYAALMRMLAHGRERLAAARPRALGLALADVPAWAVLDLAALAEGIPVVPLPRFFAPSQWQHALRDAGVDWIACAADDPRFATSARSTTLDVAGASIRLQPLESAPIALPAGTVKVTYTSGTTGAPKGVCLGEAAIEAVVRSLVDICALSPTDRHLAALPLAVLLENIGGLYAPLVAGARTVVGCVDASRGDAFDAARLLQAVEEQAITTLILVPQMLTALVAAVERSGRAPRRLRFVAVGGAAVSPRLLARADGLGMPVQEGYGLSECASVVSLNAPAARRRGSVGRPLPHANVRIATDGEIIVSGATLLGYAGSAAVAPREWRTGDLGRFDDDGYLHISGRKRNVFITAYGRNVAPEWIEGELLAHPAVAQAAVFGEARPWTAAIIVAHAGSGHADIDAAVMAANGALPDYARVRAWLLADEPFTAANGLTTANGRIRRDAVLRRYDARLARLYDEMH